MGLLTIVLLPVNGFGQDANYVSLPERIKSNVFLKVDASATDCYVGEPIIVTYRLYSAMNSESVVTRNPSFSGFEVKDLLGGDASLPFRETVDGVGFDVHVIKKLQLTPQRAGRLTIGSLSVRNNIRLIDANGNEDPILNGVQEGYSLNNGYYAITINSVPIQIDVAALPGSATRPAQFSGLVGNFKMNVQLPKLVYAPGEQGQLTITIIGVGDFSKIVQPEIEWPRKTEVFPAKESSDIKADGSGYKAYVIPFIINEEGAYKIPSIKFSFFDATSNQYKTITNIPINFHVVKEGKSTAAISLPRATPPDQPADNILWIGLAASVGLLLLLFWLVRRGRKSRRRHLNPVQGSGTVDAAPVIGVPVGMETLLRPAADRIHHTGNAFYSALKHALVQFFETRYALPAAIFNSESLSRSMKDNGISAAQQTEILSLLQEIEMHIYSGGGLDADKETLLERTRKLLQPLT
ncbi:hypothetical protein GCM10027051_04020 [Niabella terrae]